MRRLTIIFALALFAGCGGVDAAPCPDGAAEVWHDPTAVACEWPDGTKHGRSRGWYDEDRTQPTWVRYFNAGSVCGRFRIWHEDGTLAVDEELDDPCPY